MGNDIGKGIVAVVTAPAAVAVAVVTAPVNLVKDVVEGRNVGEALVDSLTKPALAPLTSGAQIIQGGNVLDAVAKPATSLFKGQRQRIIVYDATSANGLLGLTWNAAALLAMAKHSCIIIPATSWDDCVEKLLQHRDVDEVQFWGHGWNGQALIGDDRLTVDRLRSDKWQRLGNAGVIRTSGLIWFRTCNTFNTDIGRTFAETLANTFHCKAAGHTVIIHVTQEGLNWVEPGQRADWHDGTGKGCFATDLGSHWLGN